MKFFVVPFDWVKERSECSLERVFHLFAEVVDSDVKSANALKRGGAKFQVKSQAIGKIMVMRTRPVGSTAEMAGVTFELMENHINVSKRRSKSTEAEAFFSFFPSLNLEGECLVRVEGESEMLKLWQVSRKALEDLFFGF